MNGMRTDVSFTLFLSDPDSYEGGALVIESTGGEEDVKLPAGSLVAYPSTTLHRVAPVTEGVRLAAVGWARSFIRDPAQARDALRPRHGPPQPLQARRQDGGLRPAVEDERQPAPDVGGGLSRHGFTPSHTDGDSRQIQRTDVMKLKWRADSMPAADDLHHPQDLGWVHEIGEQPETITAQEECHEARPNCDANRFRGARRDDGRRNPCTGGSADKPPNIVMLMTDDTGWNDFGAYSGGGAALGHPTPNVDRIAKEGAIFTNWYGQASCTAGRASFITGRIPIRSALSIVVAPGDENYLRKETPTIAEFFKKNGYTTYFSGKWHLGDKPDSYPIEHGFDEMKHFAAYYAGVYAYNDTSKWFHPWFPTYNADFMKVVRQRREPRRVGGRRRPAGQEGRHHRLRLTWPPSTSGRRTRRSTTSRRTPRTTSRSSWTSTSSRCTTRPTPRRSSRASRISATTPTR